MARHLRIAKSTVCRYLRTPTCAERTDKRRGQSILNPYKDTVRQHWNGGGHDARQVFHLLQRQGYRRSYATVARYAQRLRPAQGLAPRQRPSGQTLPLVAEPQHGQLTPRHAAWLVRRRPETRVADDEHHLAQLPAQQADRAEAVALAREFAALVRTRQPDRLEGWLTPAATSTLSALQRFAQGLRDDSAAVQAGVTRPWSNGPVEGHITRLNMRKRQLFGRARLDLLSRRVLLAPRQAQEHGQRRQEPAETPAQSAAA